MIGDKIKPILIFLIIVVAGLFFANKLAKEPELQDFRNTESAKITSEFLLLVDRLNQIQFDVEFIASLGEKNIIKTTTTFINPNASGIGRYNPFSNSSATPSNVFIPQTAPRAETQNEVQTQNEIEKEEQDQTENGEEIEEDDFLIR